MNAIIPLCLFAAVATTSAAAQGWTKQVGMQGGVLRLKPAGTHQRDYIDRWEIPNNGSTVPDLFVVLPVTRRVALESGLAASHEKFKEASGLVPASSASDVRLTARADILLTGAAYVAAGAMLRHHRVDGSHSMQTGLLGAIGYHRPVGSSLNVRIEGQWLTQSKTDSIAPSNVYAIMFGVSRDLTSVRQPPGRSRAADGPFRPWRLQVGGLGGYVRNHFYGGIFGVYVDARETVIQFPGTGATTPPPLFVDLPLHGRLAVELGFAAERSQQSGFTLFDSHVAPRLSFAVYRGIYAAVGGNLRYVQQTGEKGFAIAGAHVASGYRVPLDAFEARVDVSYTVFKERTNFPFAQNSVAVRLGIAMALQ